MADQREYCVDTVSLILLHRHYPAEVFSPLWTNIEKLLMDGRMYAPREVMRELEKKDDEIHDWAKQFKDSLAIMPDAECLQLATEIVNNYPLVDPDSSNPIADPFVIALAQQRNASGIECCVVTEERRAGAGAQMVKIPNVCDALGVPCVRLVEVFELEQWRMAHG